MELAAGDWSPLAEAWSDADCSRDLRSRARFSAEAFVFQMLESKQQDRGGVRWKHSRWTPSREVSSSAVTLVLEATFDLECSSSSADVCVGTEVACTRAVVSVTPEVKSESLLLLR